MASRKFDLVGILILLVGAFMLLNEIAALTGNTQGLGGVAHDVSRAFGGSGNTLAIVIAVIEIAAGGLLIISRFASIGALDRFLRVALFLFWIVVMILGLVLGGNIKAVDTLGWWISLVNHSIILVILWMIKD